MKKFYLIALAALVAFGASAAAPKNVAKSSFDKKQALVTLNKEKGDFKVKDGGAIQMATDEQRAANRMNRPRKAAPLEGEAYYKRPAGVFYASRSTAGYWWSTVGSYLFGKAFSPITYTANNASNYDWQAQMYVQDDEGSWARQWLTAEGVQAITMQYQEESDSVPILSVGDGTDYFTYAYKSGNAMHAWLATVPDPVYWFAEGEEDTYGYVVVSPKSFLGDRDDSSVTYSMISYSGAKADTINGEQTSGMWFGHNLSGWNAMTLYLEKPENPYGLRSVFVDYGRLKVNAGTTADLYVKVYKIAGRTNMEEDGEEVIEYGEEIASAKVTVDENTEASGYLQFKFTEYDAGAGQDLDVTPTIDDEVAIVVSGYDDPNIADFTMYISYDKWDEGYGQHGYMNHVDEAGGVPTRCYGLNDFFTSAIGYVAPSVFLDVINPYLVGNYTIETEGTARYFYLDGTANTDSLVAMGFSETLAKEFGNSVSLYSSDPVEDAIVTDEYGNDLPNWLTVEIADELDDEGEFSGTSTATINVEAAPEGVEGRACKVKINYPGAVYYIDVVQGEPAETPDLYVLGDFQGWKPNEGLKMTYDPSQQVYTATITPEEEGCFKFTTQLAETEEWTIDEYLWGADSEGDFVVMKDQMGADLSLIANGEAFRIPAGEWTLTASLVDGTLVIDGDWPEEAMYVAGTFTNWSEDMLAMEQGEDGLYTIEIEIAMPEEGNAEFKFVDEFGKWYGGETDGNNFIITQEQIDNKTPLTLTIPGMNFELPIAGKYILTVDRENMTFTIEKVNDILKGDVNGDGIVSGADVTALYSLLLDGKEVAGDPDVNGDGVVSGADVTALYGILLQ